MLFLVKSQRTAGSVGFEQGPGACRCCVKPCRRYEKGASGIQVVDYGQSEPEAYMGSEEAMLPRGQLPVREALKPYNLEQIYDRATVRGPTASSTKPTLIQRARDYLEEMPGLGWGKF